MALFRLTTSSSALTCSGSEVHSAANASSVARNLIIIRSLQLNPGLGSLEAWDLAGSGDRITISLPGGKAGRGYLSPQPQCLLRVTTCLCSAPRCTSG